MGCILGIALIPIWFLFPPKDQIEHTDAVLVLAGASDGRHELATQIVNDGFSDKFVVSNPEGEIEKVGTAYCRGALQPESAEEVWCMEPAPSTTTGEVLTIDELASEQGWAI